MLFQEAEKFVTWPIVGYFVGFDVLILEHPVKEFLIVKFRINILSKLGKWTLPFHSLVSANSHAHKNPVRTVDSAP